MRSRAVPYGLWWAIRAAAAAGPQAFFELLPVPRDVERAFAQRLTWSKRIGCGFQRAGWTWNEGVLSYFTASVCGGQSQYGSGHGFERSQDELLLKYLAAQIPLFASTGLMVK